jgi:hypothetical protein
MARLALTARAKQPISEPEWYHGVIGVGRFLEDGHRRIMQFGDPSWHPTIRDKIKQSEQHQKRSDQLRQAARGLRPGNEHICIAARSSRSKKVHGPIAPRATRTRLPAPVVQQLLDGGWIQPVVVVIPDPPAPFIRLKGGGIAVSGQER